MLGDAFERLERETAAVPFMFPRGGKAERRIALCGAWELSIRAILLPFQTDRTYVAESVAKSVLQHRTSTSQAKFYTIHSNTRNGIHGKIALLNMYVNRYRAILKEAIST